MLACSDDTGSFEAGILEGQWLPALLTHHFAWNAGLIEPGGPFVGGSADVIDNSIYLP